jgi:hypothetical protein
MDGKKTREILGESIAPDNSLFNGVHYMAWDTNEDKIALDSRFEIEELEAIVWWMKNNKEV